MRQLNEGLSYLDMEHQVKPELGIDIYKSQIGSDDDIVTVNFTVKGKAVADDLVDWLERGYDWIIDADTSSGEVVDGQYYVFAEMNRRSNVPARVMELIGDLETLTALKPSEWKLKMGESKYPASEKEIKLHIPLSPQDYREENDEELNEWRDIAGIKAKAIFDTTDPDLLAIQRQAGIK